MDILLTLEPRVAGENLMEPRAEFTEVANITGRCYATLEPTCVGFTWNCVNTHECQPD